MRDMADAGPGAAPLRLGWEEWVALPDLGLPALKAKVDTGARTSALHAFDIEPFGPASAPHVRFAIHPVPGREDVTIACSAKVHDRREIVSSNGEAEHRFVIRTTLSLGDRHWPVEVSLTDRGAMSYRMLLGRQALGDGAMVSATDSFLHPQLGYDAYHSAEVLARSPPRTLRIAVMSRAGTPYSTRRIVEEGTRRGHVIEVLDTNRLYMGVGIPAGDIWYDGARLPHFDAIVPRLGPSVTAYGTAVLRQFQARGAWLVNPPDGITASRDKLHAHQVLARARIAMPATAFASSPKDTDNLIALAGGVPLVVKLLESSQGRGVVLAETPAAVASVISAFRGLKADFLVQRFVAEAGGCDIRCLVVDGRVVAAMRRRAAPGEFRSNLHQGGGAEPVRLARAERETAIRAARAFHMGLAGVDLLRAADGPKVLEVNSSPGLRGIETATGRNVAGALFDMIERHLRPTPARRRQSRT